MPIRSAVNLGRGFAQAPFEIEELVLEVAPFKALLDDQANLRRHKRFSDVIAGAALHGFDGIVNGGVGCHDNDYETGIFRQQLGD